MPANRVRDIFIARIEQLLSQYEESKAIDHGPTKGAMREQYLRNFLRELLPPKFSPVSGFIADMHGHITPQLDMIFIDRSELPTVSLANDTVIVPYEIALLAAEVKSTIKPEHIGQIKEQRKAIDGMQSQFLMASASPNATQTRGRPQQIGMFVMAFDSEVGEDTLRQWVEREMGVPAGICVVNRISIFYVSVHLRGVKESDRSKGLESRSIRVCRTSCPRRRAVSITEITFA